MATTGQARALRRLRQLHEKSGHKPVGVRARWLEIVIFRGWDDEWGRLRCVYFRARRLFADEARLVAEQLLGKEWLGGFEWIEPDRGRVWFSVPLDGGALHATERGPRPKLPAWIRWYEWKALEAGLGQQDSGRLTFCGRELVTAS
jgi:hypothetical protein